MAGIFFSAFKIPETFKPKITGYLKSVITVTRTHYLSTHTSINTTPSSMGEKNVLLLTCLQKKFCLFILHESNLEKGK